MAQHPLQRLKSPGLGFSITFHALGFANFAACYAYLVFFPSYINDSYGWHFQFLTIIGISIATLTFVAGLLSDLTLSSNIFLLKNSLSLCSAPLEVVISILYWGISAVDPRLVIPPGVQPNLLVDIGFHLMPTLFLVGDLLFLSPPWTIHALPTMVLSTVLAFSYWAWVEQCFKYNKWYPYPLLETLDTTQRALLFACSAMTMTASTMALKWAYDRVNGQKRTNLRLREMKSE